MYEIRMLEWLVKMVGWSSLRILRDFFEIFKDFIKFERFLYLNQDLNQEELNM